VAFTLDPTTDVGKVRILIHDSDASKPLFEDDEITAILSLENSSIKLAAASLCASLATNRAKLAVIKERGDIKDDLTKMSAAFLAVAKEFRSQAADSDELPILESLQTPAWWERNLDVTLGVNE
jgi:hypothetical protein